jgi:hypothetical protein
MASDIFDEQNVERVQRPIAKVFLDHLRFKMTATVRIDLSRRRTAARETLCIVIGFEVTNQGGNAQSTLVQLAQCAFEERRFAGAGAGDQVHHKDAGLLKARAESTREFVVLFENASAHFNNARGGGRHVVTAGSSHTSMEATSRSRPRRISPLGVSHTGQRKRCTPGSSRSLLHGAQKITIGTS